MTEGLYIYHASRDMQPPFFLTSRLEEQFPGLFWQAAVSFH